jgi:tetrachlorobenzoquinone reductase
MSVATIEVWVKTIRREAEGINAFELLPLPGAVLPPFTAGAHVTVEMNDELSRSYSLVNPQDETRRYVIAVSKDAASRGGALFMHNTVRVGDRLRVSVPQNNFRLNEAARRSVFIAGGIGITPLWCMAQRLQAIGAEWELHYAARRRSAAAFLDEMAALPRDVKARIHFHFDEELDGKKLDVAAIVAAASRSEADPGRSAPSHIYCCGPLPMLRAFEAASVSRPPDTVHVEYFATPEEAAPGGFTVELARSGRTIRIPDASSILEELVKRGIDVPYSCKEGTCGTCEVRVLAGVPDHRDVVLSETERKSNSKMMICCSGSLSESLILDV